MRLQAAPYGLLGAFNLDLPVSKRSSPIGRLTANANGSATHLSDFETITTIGAGLNWAPAERLNLTVSWNREEGPPTLQQLGDPLIETPNVSFFDFATGETVLVTTFTGGNPDLLADTRNVLKIGGNWKPFEKTDLRLRAEYVRQTIDDPQGNVSGASETLEAAFPERFVRDENGTLVAVDLRPINFQESRRDTFRWGFDFTKPLASKPPSEAARAAFRERFAGQRGPGDQSPPSPEGGPPGASPGGEGSARGIGGGRFGATAGRRLRHCRGYEWGAARSGEIFRMRNRRSVAKRDARRANRTDCRRPRS